MREFLKKNFIIIVTVFLLFSLLKSCNDVRTLNEVQDTINALKDSTYSKIEVDKKFEIQSIENEIIGYEISYRMLYDNNTVIRTKERPDDIMNNYVEKIKDLKTEIDERMVK